MIVIGITGASGSILGVRLIEELINHDKEVAVIVSEAGWSNIEYELKYTFKNRSIKELLEKRGVAKSTDRLKEYKNNDFFVPVASGSSSFDSMVVIPSSMKTLSAIANGYGDSLITRVSDVALKERRKLIIVPRETPLSLIHIENLYRAAKSGAIIIPPVPGFYHHPKTVDDIIDFIIGKIMNMLNIKNDLLKSWKEDQ